MPKRRCLVTRSLGVTAMPMAVCCVVAAMWGCSRAEPELTDGVVRAFVDARAKGLDAKDTQALCSQYADSATVNGVFGEEPVTLGKKRYCDHMAEEYASFTGGQKLVEAKLSTKSVKIPANGKSAELELEQVDVLEDSEAKRYERRTQISARVESVGGKPLITREARKETIVEAPESPQQAKPPTSGREPFPPVSPAEIEAETAKLADKIYQEVRKDIPEKDRREAARSLAVDALEIAREFKQDEDLHGAERARMARQSDLDRANIQRKECEQARAELAIAEQIVRDGPRERMTPKELSAIPRDVDRLKAILAQSCP